jgi:hypothetical protein
MPLSPETLEELRSHVEAPPSLAPKWVELLTKAKRGSVKIGKGFGGMEDGVRDYERLLDSVRASYGGGFYTGKPTDADKKLVEMQSALNVIKQHARDAATEYSRLIVQTNELIELFSNSNT